MGLLDKWNKNKFSIYKNEEKTVLKLLKNLGKWVEDLIKETDNKTDLYGDHKGTWQGYRPSQVDAALTSIIDEHTSQLAENMQMQLRKWADVKSYGAIGDGNSHKLSEKYSTLEEAQEVYPFATDLTQEIDRCAIQLCLNTFPTTFIPNGTYIIDDTLIMRFNTHLIGSNGDSVDFKTAESLENKYIIQYGTSYSYGGYKGKIENIRFSPRNVNKASLGIYAYSGIELINVTAYEAKTFFEKHHPAYIDRISIKRCNASYCYGTDTKYVINITGDNDNLIIEDLHLVSAYLENNFSSKGGIYIAGNKGGCIRNSIINHCIILDNDSAFSIDNVHMEGSQHAVYKKAKNYISIVNGDVKINCLYKHKRLDGEDILINNSGDNQYFTNVSLANCTFDIKYEFSSSITTSLNELKKDTNTIVSIKNCYRTLTKPTWTAISSKFGINITNVPRFRENSSIYSIESLIDENNDILACNDFTSPSISSFPNNNDIFYNSSSNNQVDWLIPNDNNSTYYITAVLVFDYTRKLAKFKAFTRSVTGVTSGKSGIYIRNRGSNYTTKFGCFYIYRGKTNDSYNKVCKLPIVGAKYMHDNGVHISGYLWEDRDAGNIEAFNYTDKIRYLNNKLNVEYYASSIPTVGMFTKGDRIININPTVGQPKSWVCTVTGTPGTWVSEGNL